MRASGGGSILTVTSMSVKEPVNRLLLSNVLRSGVTSLVKSVSSRRVAVLLEFMGRQQMVSVDHHQLKAA